LLDGRGSGDDGITLGDEVVINRGTTIQSKMGGISIGANSDVGASTIIVAQGGIRIGAMVTIAAGCKIGGGRIRTSSSPLEADAENLGNDFAARGQERLTKGPIRIDDRSVLLSRAMVLDGVRVGKNCLVGPGAIVLEDIPQDYVATPHQRLVAIPRTVTAGTQTSTVNEMQAVKDDVGPTDSETGDAEPHDESAEITELVFAAIDALNEMRPEDRVVSKALETSLVGASGELDSMELVNLVVDLEQRVEHALGISIILSSPDDMAGDASPFATVQSLITHIDSLTHRGHAG
jgi:acetyltransferase-like isoleucine patch superfamily enzyme/acyl carrier protein